MAMISFTMVVERIPDFSKKDHNDTFFRGVRLAGGLFALIIGVYWALAN